MGMAVRLAALGSLLLFGLSPLRMTPMLFFVYSIVSHLSELSHTCMGSIHIKRVGSNYSGKDEAKRAGRSFPNQQALSYIGLRIPCVKIRPVLLTEAVRVKQVNGVYETQTKANRRRLV
jgi:hypothetical protein